MLIFTYLIGFCSLIIFFLGIFGLMYPQYIWPPTLIGSLILFYFFYQYVTTRQFRIIHKYNFLHVLKREWLFFLLLFLFISQAVVNLLGVLGPELAFDALWYHLTLPKIYLEKHSVVFIPGGLLYYSAMPKLAEMLYIPVLAAYGEVGVKLAHYFFGLLTSFTLYLFARQFFNKKLSLLAVVIFYSNLVVAWESITAYIDLVRAFFEILALWYFIIWYQKGEKKHLIQSAISLGFAISTKLLALGSLFIFVLLFFFIVVSKVSFKGRFGSYLTRLLRHFVPRNDAQGIARNDIGKAVLFIFITLLIPLPWFIFSYVNTSNPVYPFFTSIYPVSSAGSLNPVHVIVEWWELFTHAADPISPLYLIMLPLVIIFYKKFTPEMKLVSLYSLFALIVWYLTPRTGGGRFILPYLPAFSLICVGVIAQLFRGKSAHHVVRFLLGVIVFLSLISISYRFAANYKYLPVVLGYESEDAFLGRNLNYAYGDFYDVDGYLKRTIKPTDKVLLYGFHNLYYVEFPFIDSTWVRKGDKFNYIATQKTNLPERFKNWKLIYSNKTTMVNLYSGGREWVY